MCEKIKKSISEYKLTGLALTKIDVKPIAKLSTHVIVQDLDVPGFIKRLNRNMKRVFKPKKVVERFTQKVKAQKD